jgi:hypothetical protein
MSDPIAYVPYQPNRPIPDEPAAPAGGDPDAIMAAITQLEPWQRRLLEQGTEPDIERLRLTTVHSRAALSRMANQMHDLAAAFRSEQFTGLLQFAQEHQARCSAAWTEYGRRRR